MTPKVIRTQQQQRSGINDKELHSQVSELLEELEEIQSSVHHLLDNYILKVGWLASIPACPMETRRMRYTASTCLITHMTFN